MTKKQKKSSAKSNTSKKKLYIIIAIIATAIIAAAAYLYMNRDRDITQAESYQLIQSVDEQLSFPGELVYDNISDNGCGDNPTTWLSTSKVCSYTLDKIYKGSGSAEADLRKADKIIRGGGWGAYVDPDEFQIDLEHIVTHRYATGITYLYPEYEKPRIRLIFFPRDDSRYQDTTPKQYFGIDTDIPLSGDEYLYGIRAVTGYKK